MPNIACLTGPPFSINGNATYTDGQVNFELSFDTAEDQSQALAFEWYLDSYLVINQNLPAFNQIVPCGNHNIGVRILTTAGWTGIKSMSFNACRTTLSYSINGPGTVAQGSSAEYQVLENFSDDTTADVTGDYTLSSPDGLFVGGTFTPATDFTDTHNSVITATKAGSETLTLQIVITSVGGYAGVLVVDLYNAAGMDAVGLLVNGEIAGNHVAAYTGQNTVPAGVSPATAIVLASDAIAQPTLNWRFEFNIAQLLSTYPQSTELVFQIRGRGTAAGTVNGAFVLKNHAAEMTLTGAAGSYLPSVIGNNLGSQVFYSSDIRTGANGTHALADLDTIIELTYHVAAKTITYTTRKNEIAVSNFDFMTVRYHWDTTGGTDLDILVGFENNQTAYNQTYVGYGQADATVPPATVPQANAYLWWGSDNTASAGYEAVLIGVKKFINDFPALPDVVEAGLYAIWFGAPVSGDFTVELVTYEGGTMSLNGTDFTNTGGAQVSSNIINVTTLVHNNLHTAGNAYKVGTLKYTRSTQSAIIQIN